MPDLTGLWDVTNEEYHADLEFDSHSSLELFRASIPHYAAERVYRVLPREKPTAQMILGTRVHCRVFEPAEFAKRYCVIEWAKGKGSVEANRQLEAEAAKDGKEILDAGDLAQIEAMAFALQQNETFAAAIEDSRRELSIRWFDQLTGLGIKNRLDLLHGSGLILDLKTAADPGPAAMVKTMANFGYYRQAALYLAGAWQVLGAAGPFVHVVVGSKPPFEVVAYCLDQAAIDQGHKENRETLNELAERHSSGNWESRWKDIQEISLPRWALR